MLNPDPLKRPKKSTKKKSINVTPPDNPSVPPPTDLTNTIRQISQEETKKQLGRFLAKPPEQQAFMAELSDDLTKATAPDGSE